MSTVDKNTADRVIAGEFPGDQIFAILRYENAFNGSYAYKLVYSLGSITLEQQIKQLIHVMWSINTGAPVKIYWAESYLIQPLLETELVTEADFL